MKRISLLKIMAFGVLALVHTACENAKYDVIDNLVYINEASTSKTKELTLTEGTTRTSLTVRLVNIINQTIKANLFIPQIRSESVCSNQFNCYACVRHQIEANDALVMPL